MPQVDPHGIDRVQVVIIQTYRSTFVGKFNSAITGGGNDTLSSITTYRVGEFKGHEGIIDYYDFLLGFALLFIAVPLFIGAGVGAVWAWRTGRRGDMVTFPAVVSGVALTATIIVAAVMFYGA